MLRFIAPTIAALALISCSHADNGRAPAVIGPAESTGEIDQRFVADVEHAFAEYKSWGRVDDELRWAPFLCRMPMPGRPTMSAAVDGAHAHKLYSLFAKEHDAYAKLSTAQAHPSGNANASPRPLQMIAKESYVPEVVASAPNALGSTGPLQEGDHFHPYAKGADGKTYRASQLAGVYFMIEKAEGTPGTDEGFIYATVTPSGQVTSAGRIASCMGCHAEAKHRRLFGPAQRTY